MEFEDTLPIVVAQVTIGKEVADMDLGRTPEKHVAVDSAEPPHVLVFEIAAVAPAIDFHREDVLAGRYLGEPTGFWRIAEQADNAIRASAGEPSRAEVKKAEGEEPPVNFLANNALWALVFTGNYAVNALYAFFLMWKNRTVGLILSKGRPSYWAWALFMGIAWPLGIILFGIGSNYMGEFGPFVAFPMMLVVAILFGNLAGALTGEWKGTSWRTKIVMVGGVAILVSAFAVFGWANKWLSAAPPDDPATQSSVDPQSKAQ